MIPGGPAAPPARRAHPERGASPSPAQKSDVRNFPGPRQEGKPPGSPHIALTLLSRGHDPGGPRGARGARARARGAVGEGARAGGGGEGRRGCELRGAGVLGWAGQPGGRAGAERSRLQRRRARGERAQGAEELPWVCLRIAARLGAQPALPDWTQTGAQPLAAARLASSSSRRAAREAPCPARPEAAPGPGGDEPRRLPWVAVEPHVCPELSIAHL